MTASPSRGKSRQISRDRLAWRGRCQGNDGRAPRTYKKPQGCGGEEESVCAHGAGCLNVGKPYAVHSRVNVARRQLGKCAAAGWAGSVLQRWGRRSGATAGYLNGEKPLAVRSRDHAVGSRSPCRWAGNAEQSPHCWLQGGADQPLRPPQVVVVSCCFALDAWWWKAITRKNVESLAEFCTNMQVYVSLAAVTARAWPLQC